MPCVSMSNFWNYLLEFIYPAPLHSDRYALTNNGLIVPQAIQYIDIPIPPQGQSKFYELNLMPSYYVQLFPLEQLAPLANIESSPFWDTSCLTELICDLINMQFLCGKCPKTVTIQYLLPVRYSVIGLSGFWFTFDWLLWWYAMNQLQSVIQ